MKLLFPNFVLKMHFQNDCKIIYRVQKINRKPSYKTVGFSFLKLFTQILLNMKKKNWCFYWFSKISEVEFLEINCKIKFLGIDFKVNFYEKDYYVKPIALPILSSSPRHIFSNCSPCSSILPTPTPPIVITNIYNNILPKSNHECK